MESHGQPGRIQLSSDTFELLVAGQDAGPCGSGGAPGSGSPLGPTADRARALARAAKGSTGRKAAPAVGAEPVFMRGFRFECRGLVHVKGKGEMVCWWAQRERS